MPKSNFFTGQPIFNQLLSLIPRSMVNELARRHKSDHYYKKFKTNDHLVSMLFSGFHQCSSLRELITGLQANAHRLNHLGMVCTPRRSTLADANKNRSAIFFEMLFKKLYHFHFGDLPDSLIRKKLSEKLFIVDSTTITLFSEVFKGAGTYGSNGRKKGGLKAHMLLRAKDQTPCFVHLSAAAQNDRTFMPMLNLPAGSVIVMDKGYVNYKTMLGWDKQRITWVTRLGDRLRWEVIEQRWVNEYQQKLGVRSDKIILLGNPETQKRNPLQKARIITFYDKATEREFVFLSNNLEYSPNTIAGIYKRRWDIELLFKRIKQNFQLANFLGDNENAIKIQVWCTLIADLLIKVIKDRVETIKKRKWSFANIASLIRQHLTTYIDLIKFLLNPEKAIISYAQEAVNYQLQIFKT
jgi:Transposase DDE domain/Domain of unknown function (DUF4372)